MAPAVLPLAMAMKSPPKGLSPPQLLGSDQSPIVPIQTRSIAWVVETAIATTSIVAAVPLEKLFSNLIYAANKMTREI